MVAGTPHQSRGSVGDVDRLTCWQTALSGYHETFLRGRWQWLEVYRQRAYAQPCCASGRESCSLRLAGWLVPKVSTMCMMHCGTRSSARWQPPDLTSQQQQVSPGLLPTTTIVTTFFSPNHKGLDMHPSATMCSSHSEWESLSCLSRRGAATLTRKGWHTAVLCHNTGCVTQHSRGNKAEHTSAPPVQRCFSASRIPRQPSLGAPCCCR